MLTARSWEPNTDDEGSMFPKCETIDEKSSARAWTSVLIARPLRPKNENETLIVWYYLDIYIIWLDFSLFFSRLSRNWLTSSTFSLVRTKAMRITNTCSAQCKWKKHIFLSKECEQRTMRHKIFWAKLIVAYYLKP